MVGSIAGGSFDGGSPGGCRSGCSRRCGSSTGGCSPGLPGGFLVGPGLGSLIAPPTICYTVAASGAAVEEIDIWRTAHLLMKQHAADASFVAAQRADTLMDQGDRLGCSVWLKI